jgi:hypothetical protein
VTDAGKPNAGTTHGRLRLAGLIAERSPGWPGTYPPAALTASEFAAAEWYIGKYRTWRRAMGLEPATASRPWLALTPEEQAEINTRRAETKAFWEKVQRVIPPGSEVWSALDAILLRQTDVPQLHAALRAGLDALWGRLLG